MWSRILGLAAAIILAPLGAKAADLVVLWDEGYYAEEDQAVRDVIGAFEQESGKEVELVFRPMEELPDEIVRFDDQNVALAKHLVPCRGRGLAHKTTGRSPAWLRPLDLWAGA